MEEVPLSFDIPPTRTVDVEGEQTSVLIDLSNQKLEIYGNNGCPMEEKTIQKRDKTKRKLDDASGSEISRLYPESRRKVEKERLISEFTPPGEAENGKIEAGIE
ncbi:hypothetical protein TNCV_687931 [Trichonephila clavipes]|nr:hypothetical protein TNCV_687931 [Trichonephila clavipes]